MPFLEMPCSRNQEYPGITCSLIRASSSLAQSLPPERLYWRCFRSYSWTRKSCGRGVWKRKILPNLRNTTDPGSRIQYGQAPRSCHHPGLAAGSLGPQSLAKMGNHLLQLLPAQCPSFTSREYLAHYASWKPAEKVWKPSTWELDIPIQKVPHPPCETYLQKRSMEGLFEETVWFQQ